MCIYISIDRKRPDCAKTLATISLFVLQYPFYSLKIAFHAIYSVSLRADEHPLFIIALLAQIINVLEVDHDLASSIVPYGLYNFPVEVRI